MSESKITLAQFLLKEREKRGLTQEQVAEQIGTSRTYYNQLERGLLIAGYDIRTRMATYFKRSPAFIRKLIENSRR